VFQLLIIKIQLLEVVDERLARGLNNCKLKSSGSYDVIGKDMENQHVRSYLLPGRLSAIIFQY
jgi:hypothetical protein